MTTANTIWRDFVTDGIPASGANKPAKAAIRTWGTAMESIIAAGTLSDAVWKATKAVLDADLAHAADTIGVVYDDSTSANNGLYKKSGASGSGSWTQLTTFLPGYQFVKATDAGAGTANAIVATTSPQLPSGDGVALVRLNIFETNTSEDVTVAFDGGTALTIKTVTDDKPTIGSLVAGSAVLGTVENSGTVFRLASEAVLSIAWQGAWATATTYTRNDAVKHNGASYIATGGHTSAAATEPGVGADWATVWDLLAQKGDAGVGETLPSVALTYLRRNAGNTAYEELDKKGVRNDLAVPSYVATRTALKAVDTTLETLVYLTESGREGVFVWRTGDYSASISADTQEGVYVKADAIASTSGSWVRAEVMTNGGGLKPRWFGAAVDGSASAATAINGAVAVLNLWDLFGYIDLDGGKYLIDGSLSNFTGTKNAVLLGHGATFEITATTGNILTFYSGSGGPQMQAPTVKDIKFLSPSGTPRTSGTTLNFLNVTDIVVDSCHFDYQYKAIHQSVFQYGVISNCAFRFTDRPIAVDGGSGTTITSCRGIHGSGTTPEPGSVGVDLSDGSGVMMVNCDWVRFEFGIYGRPTTGNACQFNFFTNVLGDTCDYGFYFSTGGGGTVTSNVLVNCWGSSCKQHGIYAAGVKALFVKGCRVILNQKEGINVPSGEDIHISGCFIGWNNVSNTADGSGVIFASSSAVQLHDNIFTNKSGYPGYVGATNQKHGITTGASVSRISIRGNDFTGHSAVDVYRVATPTSAEINNNTSDRSDLIATEKRGVTTATPDASGDITVTHGLLGAPTVVIPGHGNDTGAINLAAHTFGATTFKVRLRDSSNALITSGSRTLYWSASV